MTDGAMPHRFDEARARPFRPRDGVVKTAILVQLADPTATTVIEAPFGTEVMRGSFYVVADEGGSYGAAKAEFEQNHVEIASNRWEKRSNVLAYQADACWRVETHLADGTHESTVDARPGDWIIRQATGEVMVVTADAFAKRYEPIESPEGRHG